VLPEYIQAIHSFIHSFKHSFMHACMHSMTCQISLTNMLLLSWALTAQSQGTGTGTCAMLI